MRRRRSARAGVRALDAVRAPSTRALAGVLSTVRPERDPLIRDPAVNEDSRLAAWQALIGAIRDLPPLLAAAALWDAWEASQPLQRQAWFGNLLVPALLRARQKPRLTFWD